MDITELRGKIDACDDEIIRLFKERMETAEKIASYKAENDLPVFDRLRERAVINRVTEHQSEEMAMYIKMLYTTIFDLSRSYPVSYTHLSSGGRL